LRLNLKQNEQALTARPLGDDGRRSWGSSQEERDTWTGKNSQRSGAERLKLFRRQTDDALGDDPGNVA
jgi:hypothetical protein